VFSFLYKSKALTAYRAALYQMRAEWTNSFVPFGCHSAADEDENMAE